MLKNEFTVQEVPHPLDAIGCDEDVTLPTNYCGGSQLAPSPPPNNISDEDATDASSFCTQLLLAGG